MDCVEIEENVAIEISNLLNKEILCCDFLNYTENKQYDLITMGDVIEHVNDTRDAVKKAYNLLKNNGVLWISTPNYESSFNRIHKLTTGMWNEPWHITYFSKKGLENLLKQFNFEILDYKVSSHYNGSMEIIARKNI